MQITNKIRVYEDILVENETTSIQILNKAIQEQELPSRIIHAVIGIETVVTVPPFLIVRISKLAIDALTLFYDLCFTDQRAPRCIYNICRVIVLDPLYILSLLAASIIQIAASILGVVSPKNGAKWWKSSILIEEAAAKSFVEVKKKLTITDTANRLLAINPSSAVGYLGTKRAFALLQKIKGKQDCIELQRKLVDLLKFISENYPDYYNKKYPNDTIASLTDRIETEVPENLEPIYKKIEDIFLFSMFNSGLRVSEYREMLKRTHDRREEIDELFYHHNHFGCVRLGGEE